MKPNCLILWFFFAGTALAQQPLKPNNPFTGPGPAPVQPAKVQSDEEAVITIVYRLFDAMKAADSATARTLFTPGARLFTPVTNASGQTTLQEETVAAFLKSIGTKRKEAIDERILKYKIDIDGPLAQVWADYNLYVGTKFIHCGIDVFHLYKSNEGWKIFELADTRRKTNCQPDPLDEVATFLDAWHVAAANGDAEKYFGAMTPDGVFLGTDATERWTREEFRTWAKPQFDSKKGWNFKATRRNTAFLENNTIAWFDEDLSTWMGPCRGSGVLVKTPEGWKIKQYNLTILVPNEKVQEYLKVIGLR